MPERSADILSSQVARNVESFLSSNPLSVKGLDYIRIKEDGTKRFASIIMYWSHSDCHPLCSVHVTLDRKLCQCLRSMLSPHHQSVRSTPTPMLNNVNRDIAPVDTSNGATTYHVYWMLQMRTNRLPAQIVHSVRSFAQGHYVQIVYVPLPGNRACTNGLKCKTYCERVQ